jgi:branched-subunit amino acid aminotransferase/4-amino-4-deoxychorismate lyase
MSAQWLDGRLIDANDPSVSTAAQPADPDSLSCYTTARVTAGQALHPEHHVRRLQRDAKALGLGTFDPSLIARSCDELGRAVFGNGNGIVRIEARRSISAGHASLHATTRAIGIEKDSWVAVTNPVPHHGPLNYCGAKIMNNRVYEKARVYSSDAGADEALLFDTAGLLVEGARTNLLIVSDRGKLQSPNPALGAVAGIGLEIVSEHIPELELAEIRSGDVFSAREVIALNAVRGACAITRVDGQDIGSAKPGPWTERLDALLADH